MTLTALVTLLKQDQNCKLLPANPTRALPTSIPADLKTFYELTDGGTLFDNAPYSITIVGREELIPTHSYLYPADDVIWDELEGEVSNKWYLIAKADEMSQYISIDLTEERNGQCYDSFYEIHSLVGDSAIVAKNFTELLVQLYQSKGQYWYWLQDNFKPLGDAYDDPII